MGQISSGKWKLQVGKNIHILTQKEVDFLLANQEKRFVVFKDLILNPAFVADMVLVESEHSGVIEAPNETDLPSDEWVKKHTTT